MCQIKPRLTKNQFHKNKYCLCRRMTRHTQIPDTYELFLDFLKTSINNQNKICLSDSQIICTQIVKAIISIWNQLTVAQFKLDASKLNSSLTELGPAQPQLVNLIIKKFYSVERMWQHLYSFNSCILYTWVSLEALNNLYELPIYKPNSPSLWFDL